MFYNLTLKGYFVKGYIYYIKAFFILNKRLLHIIKGYIVNDYKQ